MGLIILYTTIHYSLRLHLTPKMEINETSKFEYCNKKSSCH